MRIGLPSWPYHVVTGVEALGPVSEPTGLPALMLGTTICCALTSYNYNTVKTPLH